MTGDYLDYCNVATVSSTSEPMSSTSRTTNAAAPAAVNRSVSSAPG